MTQIQVWQIKSNSPVRIQPGEIDLEKHLENWIEQDPDLLQTGLEVIGRQCYLFGNKLRLDLLALNPQGELVVIELKPGFLYSGVITQALDYASILCEMPFSQLEQLSDSYLSGRGKSLRSILQTRKIDPDSQSDQREVQIIIVGVNKDPGLERLAGYLSGRYNIPISIVSFGVHQLDTGELILTREDDDFHQIAVTAGPKITVEKVCDAADQNGIGPEFRSVLDVARSLGLYPRAYATCIMYAPPGKKNRALFTVWNGPNKEGNIGMYIGARVFPEFYPINEQDAIRILGEKDWQEFPPDEIAVFLDNLKQLFAEIQKG